MGKRELLILIAQMGGTERPVVLSTTKISKLLGISQQSASRWILELEKEGLLERNLVSEGQELRLTPESRSDLFSLYNSLKSAFGRNSGKTELSGRLFTGIGEGRYYIGQKGYAKQIEEKLGFHPFPGTFNLKLETREDIINKEMSASRAEAVLESFSTERRTFGKVKCIRASIKKLRSPAYIIIPERTHHKQDVLELISPVEIRKKLKLKDGDRVTVSLGE